MTKMAERLKAELNDLQKQLPGLEKDVETSIRKNGIWKAVCHEGIKTAGKRNGKYFSIPGRLERAVMKWAVNEGLEVTFAENGYHVRLMEIGLKNY